MHLHFCDDKVYEWVLSRYVPVRLRCTHQERGPLRCGRCRAHTAPLIRSFRISILHGKRDAILEGA
jgi:hypothetical protein